MRLEALLEKIKNSTYSEDELKIRGVYDFTVSDDNLSDLLDALKQPNNIRKIFLESNLTVKGIQMLAKFLENNTQVESLELWNPQFSFHNKINDNLSCFVPAVQHNKTLKRLVLYGIGVENSQLATFFDALKENNSIEFLSLPDNNFNHSDVARQIAEVISNNKTLKTLNLGGHWFEEEELNIIANALLSNTTLENLDVSGPWVNDEGPCYLQMY